MDPKDMHRRNAMTEHLSEDFGPGYAAVIGRAGQLRKTLTVDTANYDWLHINHIEGRYRGLLQLDGLTMAAIEILKAEPHNQSHYSAEALAKQHIASMARAIERDVEDAARRAQR